MGYEIIKTLLNIALLSSFLTVAVANQAGDILNSGGSTIVSQIVENLSIIKGHRLWFSIISRR